MERLRNIDTRKALLKITASTALAAGVALATAGPVRSESPSPVVVPDSAFVSEYQPFSSEIPPIYYVAGIAMVFVGLGAIMVVACESSASASNKKDNNNA